MDLGSNGTLINAGTINVGASHTMSQTMLTGDLTQTSTGRLVVDTDHVSGASDTISISGQATIGGTVHVQATKVSNKAVTVLMATGGVRLDPQLATTDDKALYSFRTQALGNSVQVAAIADFNKTATSLGDGRQAVAGNLQTLFDSGAAFDAGFNALAGVQSVDAFDKSLAAISGQAVGAVGALRAQTSRTFSGNLYSGCESFDATSVTSDGSKCGWARAFGSDIKQDESTDALGYQAKSYGFQLGGQTEIADNLYLTGAVAYQNSKINDGGHTATIDGDSVLAGIGIRYHNGPLHLMGAIDTGRGWYDSKRTIAVGGLSDIARGKPREWATGLHAYAAYTASFGGVAYVKPFADAHVIYVDSGNYAERGLSPFNLDVAKQADTVVSGAAGLEVGASIGLKGGATLRPFASAAIDLRSKDNWTTQARFVSQSGDRFSVDTAMPNTLGQFRIGAELKGAKNVDFSLQYAPEFGNGYTSHTGIARLAIRF